MESGVAGIHLAVMVRLVVVAEILLVLNIAVRWREAKCYSSDGRADVNVVLPLGVLRHRATATTEGDNLNTLMKYAAKWWIEQPW